MQLAQASRLTVRQIPDWQPPVSESHWRMLLQDMLAMQWNVYMCLDSDACYEFIHCDSWMPHGGSLLKELIRCCLQQMTDRPCAIQEELDLIQALGCLEEFGVKILPLQVRLCSDRIGLIKECISQSPTCYKQSAKLLGLAEFLRVAGYSKSWDVCSQLGQSEGYQNLATHQELMAFALTRCPPGNSEPLLAASSSL
ncbi:neuroblastoma-amplified sequence-like [Choloepus didactylus]|uniref:neuroblastoma-amplified sequence-like n=1 Tax=Choloepus didactylus TaxID=27675 RepID=UPI00189EAA39|nr:neuroblastoma-amplified sequence-like [Choloepus didactylus]